MTESMLVVVTTTVASESDANDLARHLVQVRLVACAQVDGPLTSHYVWQGQTCCDQEWRITLKTTKKRLTALYHEVLLKHPYQCPQWIVQAVDAASEAYDQWVADQTQVDPE